MTQATSAPFTCRSGSLDGTLTIVDRGSRRRPALCSTNGQLKFHGNAVTVVVVLAGPQSIRIGKEMPMMKFLSAALLATAFVTAPVLAQDKPADKPADNMQVLLEKV